MPKRPAGQPRGDQRWSTFLKNHAKAIVACDFFVAVTATFRLLYVFVVIEHHSRRLSTSKLPRTPVQHGRYSNCGRSLDSTTHTSTCFTTEIRYSRSTSMTRSRRWGMKC